MANAAMKFQRVQGSIIKSIRQISLYKEWLHLRGSESVPLFDDFIPDTRSGDAHDIAMTDVVVAPEVMRLMCRKAGKRFEEAYGQPMRKRFIDECLPPVMTQAARPMWEACVDLKLPIYMIIPTADRDGVPVTLEQLFLPFGEDSTTPTHVIASLNTFSTEGRYQLDGLLQPQGEQAPLHWAVVIDPEATLVPNASPPSNDVIELEDLDI